MTHDGGDRTARSGRDRRVSDDGGGVSWDTLDKISKIAVYPIIGALLYLLIQSFGFATRLAIIEVNVSRPVADVEMIRKIAVIEDRQNMVMKGLAENGQRIDRLSDLISEEGGRVGGRKR